MHIAVDLNCRVRGNQTFAGFEDASSIPQVGEPVFAHEVESNICAPAVVTDVDSRLLLIYLSVTWREFGACRHES